jgi:hypothetical protein
MALSSQTSSDSYGNTNGNGAKKAAGIAGGGEVTAPEPTSGKKAKKANGVAKEEKASIDDHADAANGKKVGVNGSVDRDTPVNGSVDRDTPVNGSAALHEKLSKGKNDAGKAGRVTAAVNAVAAKAAATQGTEAKEGKEGATKSAGIESKSSVDKVSKSPKTAGIATEQSSSPSKSSTATLKKIDPATQPASASAFNGLGKCAVFPVPTSSLTGSVWAAVLSSSSSDLDVDPFGKLILPISELLDLTLPPVDGVSLTPWPKAPSYYYRGVGADGRTHSPASQHALRYTQPQGQLPGGGVIPSQMMQYEQQLALQQQQQALRQQAISQGGVGVGVGGAVGPGLGMQTPNGSVGKAGTEAGTIPNIAALQQMFPGVKMSVGAPGQQGAKNT